MADRLIQPSSPYLARSWSSPTPGSQIGRSARSSQSLQGRSPFPSHAQARNRLGTWPRPVKRWSTNPRMLSASSNHRRVARPSTRHGNRHGVSMFAGNAYCQGSGWPGPRSMSIPAASTSAPTVPPFSTSTPIRADAEQVGPPEPHLLEGLQGHADDLGRRRQANAPPDQAHLQLQASCLDKLVQGGLQARREFLEVPVLEQVSAAVGDLFLLPGQQFLGGVCGSVPVDGVVVDTAEQQEVLLAVRGLPGTPGHTGARRASASGCARSGPRSPGRHGLRRCGREGSRNRDRHTSAPWRTGT